MATHSEQKIQNNSSVNEGAGAVTPSRVFASGTAVLAKQSWSETSLTPLTSLPPCRPIIGAHGSERAADAGHLVEFLGCVFMDDFCLYSNFLAAKVRRTRINTGENSARGLTAILDP
jgi:hypothetical protein